MIEWHVVVGTKRGGPFDRARLRKLVDVGKISGEAFVQDTDGLTDWRQVQTIDWLCDTPELFRATYCPECDCRLIVSRDEPVRKGRCPSCSANVTFYDFLDDNSRPLEMIPVEPWGKYDTVVFAAACIAIAAGAFAALSLLWNPWLAVLLGFIFLVAGGALFGFTFNHRSQSSKYRTHMQRITYLLNTRTDLLLSSQTELNSLKRNLVQARNDLNKAAEEEFRQQRTELAAQLETARDSMNAVHRMAERFDPQSRGPPTIENDAMSRLTRISEPLAENRNAIRMRIGDKPFSQLTMEILTKAVERALETVETDMT